MTSELPIAQFRGNSVGGMFAIPQDYVGEPKILLRWMTAEGGPADWLLVYISSCEIEPNVARWGVKSEEMKMHRVEFPLGDVSGWVHWKLVNLGQDLEKSSPSGTVYFRYEENDE